MIDFSRIAFYTPKIRSHLFLGPVKGQLFDLTVAKCRPFPQGSQELYDHIKVLTLIFSRKTSDFANCEIAKLNK